MGSKKKQTVIKLDMNCDKCRTEAMSAVAKLNGVTSMTIDENRKTLTVVGEVEPMPIFKKLKKIKKKPEIVTVGPPRPRCPPYCHCRWCRPYNYSDDPPWNPNYSYYAYGPCQRPETPPQSYYQTYGPGYLPSYPRQCDVAAVYYPPPNDPGQCTIL